MSKSQEDILRMQLRIALRTLEFYKEWAKWEVEVNKKPGNRADIALEQIKEIK